MVIKYIRTHSKLSHIFRKYKIELDNMVPELQETRKTEDSIIYRYSIPPGFTLADFEKTHEAIEIFLDKEISIKAHAKNIIIEVYNDRLEQFDFEFKPTNKGFFIGRGRGKKEIYVNFDQWPHLGIFGETNSGKSTLLRCIIVTAILLGWKIHAIDLKRGAELGIFKDHPSVLNFARTINEASTVIDMFSEEIDRRYDLFFEKGIVDFKNSGLDRQLLVIDEFAELTIRDEKIANKVRTIAGRARASGLNLIICTQRPSADVLTGITKAALTNIVGLQVVNRINSEVIGIPGLEKLHGNGHGIFKCNTQFTEFQAPYLSVEEAKRLLGLGAKN
jgi:S-DNA-T family DNA segregation ATPase FtsK/SpoIIIE